jgi:methanesulfonate monooxygenase subunit alpha
MTASATQGHWDGPPRLPTTHYLDNRIYSDAAVFEEEQKRIFAGGWKLLCHESELPASGDYRVFKVAGRSVVTVRGDDGLVRSFYNACAHRGAELVRDVRGNLKNFRCFYHLWAYDLEGQNTSMTRPQGYQSCGLRNQDANLRALRTEVLLGLVFVSLNDHVEPLAEYLGEILPDLSKHLGSDELEVFHHHSAVIQANWKFWNDNNTEVYHEYLHVLNRRTMVQQPGYHDRRWKICSRGHGTAGEVITNYSVVGLEARAENLFPGVSPNGLIAYGLFPDVLLIMRSTVMRLDTMTPLAPDRTLLEWRGLGLKSDTPEVRAMRLRQHNQVWGPAGRNLAEDVAAVESQQRNVMSGASRYSIIAREEDRRPHDDCFFRAYYQEWGRRIGRWPHDLDAKREPVSSQSPRRQTANA